MISSWPVYEFLTLAETYALGQWFHDVLKISVSTGVRLSRRYDFVARLLRRVLDRSASFAWSGVSLRDFLVKAAWFICLRVFLVCFFGIHFVSRPLFASMPCLLTL